MKKLTKTIKGQVTMYRCLDCGAEYEECPDFCTCGNDGFEEIVPPPDYYEQAETFEYADEPVNTPVRPRLTAEEIRELEAEKKEKLKTMAAAGVILFLCILVFLLPPHKKQRNTAAAPKKAVQETKQLPSVKTFWDDTAPSSAYKSKDRFANLPLLNSRLGSLSPQMREYLTSIGRSFNSRWDAAYVKGTGTCKVQFVINKSGGLDAKNIISGSGNQSLDDSVLMLLTNTTGFNAPPADYKGEKIYINFIIDKNGESKIKYPAG